VSGYGDFNEEEPDESSEDLPEITIPPEWVPGVYANLTFVAFSPTEFTIDFVRMDPYNPSGVVVARISLPAETANNLALHLGTALHSWAEDAVANLGGDGNGQTFYRPEDPGPEPPE
jgi:hypothetical protein